MIDQSLPCEMLRWVILQNTHPQVQNHLPPLLAVLKPIDIQGSKSNWSKRHSCQIIKITDSVMIWRVPILPAQCALNSCVNHMHIRFGYVASCAGILAAGTILGMRGYLSPCPRVSKAAAMGWLGPVPGILLAQDQVDLWLQIRPWKEDRIWCMPMHH